MTLSRRPALALVSALSLSRVVLVVPLVLLLARGDYLWALVCMALATASDLVDGWVARRLKLVTSLGATLDILSDKIFLFVSLTACAVLQLVPVWLVLVVVFRDVVILAGALTYRMKGGRFDLAPSFVGKLNIALVMLLLVEVVASQAGFVNWPLGHAILVWACVFVTLWSAGHYVWDYSTRWSALRAQLIQARLYATHRESPSE